MKKKEMIFFGIALLISAIFILFLAVSCLKEENISSVRIKDRNIKVEVAADSESQQEGLGKREAICDDCGMLFIFPEKKKASFWMKDMNFDLDIVWIADSKVIYISKNVDHSSLEKIGPEAPSDMVLELNAGFCDKYGIKPGEEVSLE